MATFHSAPFAFRRVAQRLAGLVQGGLQRPLPASGFQLGDFRRGDFGSQGEMCMLAGHRLPPTRGADGPTSGERAAHGAIVMRVGRDFRQVTTVPGILTELPWAVSAISGLTLSASLRPIAKSVLKLSGRKLVEASNIGRVG